MPLLAAIAADVRPATLERELAIMAETDLSEHVCAPTRHLRGKCPAAGCPSGSWSSANALKVHYAALMDQGTADLAMAIGARVEQERQSRRMDA